MLGLISKYHKPVHEQQTVTCKSTAVAWRLTTVIGLLDVYIMLAAKHWTHTTPNYWY